MHQKHIPAVELRAMLNQVFANNLVCKFPDKEIKW